MPAIRLPGVAGIVLYREAAPFAIETTMFAVTADRRSHLTRVGFHSCASLANPALLNLARHLASAAARRHFKNDVGPWSDIYSPSRGAEPPLRRSIASLRRRNTLSISSYISSGAMPAVLAESTSSRTRSAMAAWSLTFACPENPKRARSWSRKSRSRS